VSAPPGSLVQLLVRDCPTEAPKSAEAFAAAPAEAAAPPRIRHVDSLRAVAAGLVVWLHIDQFLNPSAPPTSAFLNPLQDWPSNFDPGRMGVMIFFAISGFVICRSFGKTREGSVRRFLIRRVCRLYPAYWVSMLGALLVWWLKGQTWTWADLAANATMIPATLGQTRLLGVYWTLEIELLFYALCVGLHLARWLDRRAVLAALVIVLVWLPKVLRFSDEVAGTHFAISRLQATTCLSLSIMFWAALFRMAYDETGGFRRDWRAHRSSLLLVGFLMLMLIDVPDMKLKWFLLGMRPGPLPGHLMTAGALVIFALWVAWLRVETRFLSYLGVISYSLYLFHLVAIDVCNYLLAPERAGGWLHPPLWLCYLVGTALTIALAAAVYRWVEQPAIAFGKRWAKRSPAQIPP
jgi:peptidoglycan/LPS O-acetylase OafA/YrhL